MQGFNMGRYYQPDASNPPSFNASSHSLGKRASKISQGILTVRFELPFAVWCNHCTPQAIIGQGVRFNAEKKKVGNYYSTPIWSFRMKHGACGGWWEIRTDPKIAEYVIVEGAKKRDYGPEDKGARADGDLKFLTEEEKERRRNDVFADLDGKIKDRGTEKKNKERVGELYEQNEVWRDPYEVNARLRTGFREKRKVWKKEDRHKEGMQGKFSLGIDIVDETEADRMRASIVEFTGPGGNDKSADPTTWKPLFKRGTNGAVMGAVSTTKKLNSETKARKSRQNLQHSLVSNTKAAIDPFISNANSVRSRPTFAILKRKRDIGTWHEVATSAMNTNAAGRSDAISTASKKATMSAVLVDYDSD